MDRAHSQKTTNAPITIADEGVVNAKWKGTCTVTLVPSHGPDKIHISYTLVVSDLSQSIL